MKSTLHLSVKKIFTSVAAIAFVFVSVVPTRALAIETGAGSPFDIESAVEGMSDIGALAGIVTTCVAAYYLSPTIGVSTAAGGVGNLSSYLNITSANGPVWLEKSAAATALTAAGFLGGSAVAVDGILAGEGLGGVANAVASVPTSDKVAEVGIGAALAAQSAQMLDQAAQSALKVAEVQAKSPKEAENIASKGILDCLVYQAGQNMLNQLTESTVTWIKGGFHGSPSFTVDTHKTFIDLADMVAGDLARELRGVAMCDFRVNFKNDLANTVELSAKRQYKFAGKTKCPFPETFNINSSDFYKGVNKFSWGAMEYAMQDSGNPFGIAMLTGEELAARSSEKKEVRQQELAWSNGFTNIVDTENCTYPPHIEAEINNVGGIDQATGATIEGISPAQLREYQKTYCKTTTPGKMLGDKLSEATGVDMQRLGLVDNVNKIVGALISAVTTKAAEGIFEAVSGQDIEIPTEYITAREKTAETIAMENAALKPYYDAWQAEIKRDKDAQTELVRLQAELADAQANYGATGTRLSDITDLQLKIEEQEAIIQAAPEKIAAAKAAYDDAASPERSLLRQRELQAAQAKVDTAKSAVQTAENTAIRAQEAYYKALMTEALTDGDKFAMDEANAALAAAQAELQIANDRLYTAQHPAYSPPAE